MSEIKTEFISDLSGYGAPIGAVITSGETKLSVYVRPNERSVEFFHDEPGSGFHKGFCIPIDMSAAFLDALLRMHGRYP
jgi:hypothetical protein